MHVGERVYTRHGLVILMILMLTAAAISVIPSKTEAAPPSVTIWYPNGGEKWTGGMLHSIDWLMTDDFDTVLTVWINYSLGGPPTYPITPGQGLRFPVGNNTHKWLVPCVNSTSVLIHLTSKDSNGEFGYDESDAPFTIDCTPPWVVSTYPMDNQIDVPVQTSIVVTFSEPMNQNYSMAGFSITPYVVGYFNWPSPYQLYFTPNNGTLAECTQYVVTQDGNLTRDESFTGNRLDGNFNNVSEGSPDDDFVFKFTTVCFGPYPPTVTLLSPVGGEDWTGGQVKNVRWNASDPQEPLSNLTIDVYYALDWLPPGPNWIPIVLGLRGTVTSYPWSVPYNDTDTAYVRVCATNSNNQTGCGTGQAFTIDSTPPQVAGVDPPNGATGVPVNQTIAVTWAEVMDISVGNIMIVPTIPITYWWDTQGLVYMFTASNMWAPCTNYTIGLFGFKDDSETGNIQHGTYYYNFTTACPGPPNLSLGYPFAGLYLGGGSTQRVWWTASDDTTPLSNLTFYLNYTSGVSSGSIAGPLVGVRFYFWTLPLIDANDVVVNITAIDEDGMQSWDESGFFTIDSTPPSLVDYQPTGDNVPLDAEAYAFFDEPVSAMLNYTKESFGLQDLGTNGWVSVTWIRNPPGALFLQEFRFMPDALLTECDSYTAFINGTFSDRGVNPLQNPTSWTFNTVCPPDVSFIGPVGGEDWSGGSVHAVSFMMSDDLDAQLYVRLHYSLDNGADGYPYMVFQGFKDVGVVVYQWTVPLVDSEAVRLRVNVQDSAGLPRADYSGVFTIDSTPPGILTTVPTNNSSGVTITDDVQIVFTEKVVRPTAEQAFSISPNPGDITFTWETTGLGKDVLKVGHKPFKSKTDYKVTFGTVLRDDSNPGNGPASPLTFRFSTKPPPDVQPPVALAVGKNQVQVGEPVTLDGSGSMGNITKFVWTIVDNQHNIVEVLVGEIVVYTFQKNGRYAVILTVTDETTGLSGEDSIEIVVTSNPDAGLLILFASAALIGGLIAGTEATRVPLMTILLAAVNRRKFNKKEDSVGRGMVLGYILVHPGDCYSEIKHNLHMNDGTLTWHLMKLEKDERIKSMVQGTRKRYFPVDVPLPVENGGELHDIEKRLIALVESDPGMSVKLLAEELGVSRQLALYHLRKLNQRGLLSLERKGLYLRAYPGSEKNT